MRTTVVLAIVIALISTSGCAFLMKEYDDRNERKLAELSDKNKALNSKVKKLERKVPGMNEEINALGSEHRNIEQKISDLDRKLQGNGDIDNDEESSRPDAPAPAPAPEKPFKMTTYDETKPEPPAKATLTEAGAKLLEMAKKQEDSGGQPTMKDSSKLSAKPEEMTGTEEITKTEEMTEPEEMTEAEEMALAEEMAAAEEIEQSKPQPEKAYEKSALTAEGARLLALAKGEPAPSESSDEVAPASEESEKAINQTAKVSAPAAQSVRLKVLSGTGNIVSAHTMAKKLRDMGFEVEKKALAPRSNFTRNVVYHAKGYEQTAEDLKNKLGERTVIKPITWNSKFDIIVVSVE